MTRLASYSSAWRVYSCGLLLSGLLHSSLLPTPAQQPEPPELKLGQQIERQLETGNSHSYRIALTSGQYFNATIEQVGMNVAVEVFDPKGKHFYSADWRWRDSIESIWLLAESTGDFLLTIKVPDQAIESGRYKLKVEKMGDWSQAPSTDKDVVNAHKAFGEAQIARNLEKAEGLSDAIEKFKKVLPFWEPLKDANGEAHTYYELGALAFRAGKVKEAAEYFNSARERFRSAGNQGGELSSLSDLSWVTHLLGDQQKALTNYNEALLMARNIRNPVDEANVLAGMGLVLDRLGQPDKAIATYHEMLALARGMKNLNLQASANNNLGLAHARQGRLTEAIKHYQETLSILHVYKDRFGEATTLTNIGNAYARMGEFQKALEYLIKGLEMKRVVGDRRGEAIALGGIGNLYVRLEDNGNARNYYEQSLMIGRAIGSPEEQSVALTVLGGIYAKTGELDKALDLSNQALAFNLKLGDRAGEAYPLTNLGSIHFRKGELQKALAYYDKALVVRREVGDQYGEVFTLIALGDTHLKIGNSAKALEYLDQALALTKSTGDQVGEASSLFHLARAERQKGNAEKARKTMVAALAIVESTRTKVTLADVRAIYFASRQSYYEFYIDLLMQLFKANDDPSLLAEALRANERRTARSLLDSLSESRADIHSGVSTELLERHRRLQQDLNSKADQQARLLSRKHTEQQAAKLRSELGAITVEYEQALAQIRQSSPRYAALMQPVPLDVQQIQQQILDRDTILLAYALGQERSYLWGVTANSIEGFELPSSAEIEAAAREVYESLTARNLAERFEERAAREGRVAKADAAYASASAKMSQMLFGPIAGKLGRKRLLIVADGALQYIPFGALPPPVGSKRDAARRVTFEPMATRHEIIYLPSASALAVLRKELAGSDRGTKTLAVLADPVFTEDDQRVKRTRPVVGASTILSGDSQALEKNETSLERSAREVGNVEFRRLPNTRREANGITAFAPKKMVWEAFDFEASRTAVTAGDLGDYRILHFATHAFLNSHHPELSGIVLSLVDENGKPQDGFLRLHEIYNLKLNAELVVLSACRTALGKEIKGEGLVGLTRGFMYAGSPRIVASLWAVDDEITAELMTRFYREMFIKRQRPAAALRAAQVSIWREKRLPPYFWAAFVFQGEWK